VARRKGAVSEQHWIDLALERRELAFRERDWFLFLAARAAQQEQQSDERE
jgi:hypothetical protein